MSPSRHASNSPQPKTRSSHSKSKPKHSGTSPRRRYLDENHGFSAADLHPIDYYTSPPSSPLRYFPPQMNTIDYYSDSVSLPPASAYERRSITPPPPVQAPKPSEQYIQASLLPSTSLARPTVAPKLLILDLNGTLVHRAPRLPHAYSDPNAIDTNGERRFRFVHPRPYLRQFVDYVCKGREDGWLDTMVWSSAQPHNVGDMVSRTFGERDHELLAVWARDRMGLTKESYHKKTQTIKDLNKPWTEIEALYDGREPSFVPRTEYYAPTPRPPSPSAPAPTSPEETHLRTETPGEVDSNKSRARPLRRDHSERSTLLLDDSPKKAALQPWNHLCVTEYELKNENTDRFLLAAIGILDVVKWESNVVGWVRGGGLSRGESYAPATELPPDGQEVELDEFGRVRRKGAFEDDEEEWHGIGGPQEGQGQGESRRARRSGRKRGKDKRKEREAIPAVPSLDAAQQEGQVKMWYDDETNFEAWIRRGRRALQEAKIEVEA